MSSSLKIAERHNLKVSRRLGQTAEETKANAPNNLSGFLLGAVYCMQYTDIQGACYKAVEEFTLVTEV